MYILVEAKSMTENVAKNHHSVKKRLKDRQKIQATRIHQKEIVMKYETL